jgi:hypothetical protein
MTKNTAHIAVATTKAIYLEEDIFTHKKNHTTLQKKTPTKSTPKAFFTPQNHTTPKLKQQHICFSTHKTRNPKLKQQHIKQHICLTTLKKKNPKNLTTTTTTKLPLYPQNKEPQNSTTTRLMRLSEVEGRKASNLCLQ